MADPQRIDTILRAAIAVLVTAVLAFGGWFGYTVYRDRLAAEDAVPALRLSNILRKEVAANPNNAVLRVRLGEALSAAGRTQQAIEQFNAALKIDPKHTGALLDLGILAMQNKRPEEAIAFFKKVVDLTADDTMAASSDRRENAFYNLGLIYYNQRDYQDAVGYFKGALRIRNDSSDTYVLLAQSLEELGQSYDAKSAAATALRFDPSFAQAYYVLAKLLLAEGDKVGASYNAGRALELAPGSLDPKNLVAKVGDPVALAKAAQAEVTSNPEQALEDAQIAFNLDRKNNIPAAKIAGKILLAQGHKAQALALYTRAAEVAPTDATIAAAVKALTPKPKTTGKSGKKPAAASHAASSTVTTSAP
jgi:tetratricopeptide (TPR) repeat protein